MDKRSGAPMPIDRRRQVFDRGSRRRPRAAFTLVELLVVIAIISILAGMLMPALEDALNAARTVDCQNRLKTIGVNTTFYIDDHDATIPVGWADLTPYMGPDWYGHITWKPLRVDNPAMCPIFVNYTEYNGAHGTSAPLQEYHRCEYWRFATYRQNHLFQVSGQGQASGWSLLPQRGYRTPYTWPKIHEIQNPTMCINYIEWCNNNMCNSWRSARFLEQHGYRAPSVQLDCSVTMWDESYKAYGLIYWATATGQDNPTEFSDRYYNWATYLWFRY